MLDALSKLFQTDSAVDVLLAIVDFALVNYLIYQVLMLIKGTRAVQILVGLLLIIVGYFLSRDEYLGLPALNWLLENFIGSFILVVVVLFQEDIRRGLSKFGRSRFLGGLSSGEEAHLVEELVRGCFHLSDHRLGALIAVERGGDLSRYVEEAIKVDAALTREMLFAVFNPDNANPLHDGAVIVQHGRIAAAGSFLPLTTNPRVDKSLGTRHRAGIGLSEDTDAAVLIVSEETGIVSLALEGTLARNLDPNTLRGMLQALLGVRERGDRGPLTRADFGALRNPKSSS